MSVAPILLHVAFSLYLQQWKSCSAGRSQSELHYVHFGLGVSTEEMSSGFSCPTVFSPSKNHFEIRIKVTMTILDKIKLFSFLKLNHLKIAHYI